MRSPAKHLFATTLAAAMACLLPCLQAAEEGAYVLPAATWKPLFNGRDLSGWDKYLATAQGEAPLVANVDPNQVFTVVTEEGAPAIRVSGTEYGAITTRDSFENFHFRIQFKWGLARWGDRAKVARDSGILYCGVGAPNPRTGWLTSVENNIMEKGVGQWWSVNGALIDVEGEWITAANELYVPYKKEGPGEKNIVWKPGAARLHPDAGNGITPPFDVEYVFGNWNTAEVVFWAGQCIHILNGHVNLVAVNPRHLDAGAWKPLLSGRIQLQSEGAELYYRNPEIRPLHEMPAEYRSHMLSPVADEAGFTDLLAPDTLKQWRQCGPGSFEHDPTTGILTGKGGMGLFWYSGGAFTNFVLRGEFRQSGTLADSGVFLRFPDPKSDPWNAVRQGHEMEIGDPNPKVPTWRTGSLYPFQPSTTANTRPAGEWNSYELTAIGHNYAVRINGQVVTTWTDSTQRSVQGYIGLQNYDDGQSVSHRRLRIRPLP